MVDMARKEILPAVCDYVTALSDAVTAGQVFEEDMRESFEFEIGKKLIALKKDAFKQLTALENKIEAASKLTETAENALYFRAEVIPTMKELRKAVDAMETLTAADFWPMPTYGDLLFGVM